jgi:hypothetical protein
MFSVKHNKGLHVTVPVVIKYTFPHSAVVLCTPQTPGVIGYTMAGHNV